MKLERVLLVRGSGDDGGLQPSWPSSKQPVNIVIISRLCSNFVAHQSVKRLTHLRYPFWRNKGPSFYVSNTRLSQPSNQLYLRLQRYRDFLVLQAVSWADFNDPDVVSDPSSSRRIPAMSEKGLEPARTVTDGFDSYGHYQPASGGALTLE